jgi:hypothetical protein
VHILAYSDDMDTVWRSLQAFKIAFISLKRAAWKIGFIVNEIKTKFVEKTNKLMHETHLIAGDCRFKNV